MPRVTPDLSLVTLSDPESDNAKQVILDIIAARGGRFAGKTLLYKAFYLAHLYYWRDHHGVLTDYPIVRMPNGPGIDRGDRLIQELVEAGLIGLESRQVGPYQEAVFVLAKPYSINNADPRHRAVLDAVEWIGDRPATEVCDIIHQHSRTWRAGKDGDLLPIYLDLLSDEDFERRRVEGGQVDEFLRSLFGGDG